MKYGIILILVYLDLWSCTTAVKKFEYSSYEAQYEYDLSEPPTYPEQLCLLNLKDKKFNCSIRIMLLNGKLDTQLVVRSELTEKPKIELFTAFNKNDLEAIAVMCVHELRSDLTNKTHTYTICAKANINVETCDSTAELKVHVLITRSETSYRTLSKPILPVLDDYKIHIILFGLNVIIYLIISFFLYICISKRLGNSKDGGSIDDYFNEDIDDEQQDNGMSYINGNNKYQRQQPHQQLYTQSLHRNMNGPFQRQSNSQLNTRNNRVYLATPPKQQPRGLFINQF